MTHVSLRRRGNLFCVQAKGHATGSVEVCAAVSCLLYTLAGYLMNNPKGIHCIECKLSEADVDLCFRGEDAAKMLFAIARIGFLQLENSFSKFLCVNVDLGA